VPPPAAPKLGVAAETVGLDLPPPLVAGAICIDRKVAVRNVPGRETRVPNNMDGLHMRTNSLKAGQVLVRPWQQERIESRSAPNAPSLKRL